jgi:hypothetical protein
MGWSPIADVGVGNKMNALHTSAFLVLALASIAAHAADFYFGGTGDTNTHWVGFQLAVDTSSFAWKAYTLDPARRGRIKIAPATFTLVRSNTWTANFDEYFRRGNGEGYGLAHHELQISIRPDRRFIQVHDGREVLDLLRVSREDLVVIKSGRIPNPQRGANGSQSFSSETNTKSSAAGSRR